jgi:lycopene beta-cyclase
VKVDLALVGGGLANSLIAYRILRRRPDFALLVFERGASLGADHTWSFHESDLMPEQRAWVGPLVAHTWPEHELRFPRRRRVIQNAYNTVTSSRLHEVVGRALGGRLRFGVEVAEVAPTEVRLGDGTRIEARAVIDGRGDPGGEDLDLGYQKFLGLFVRLDNDHGLGGPILMDATVEQRGGYRFVYTLPFSDRDLLVEDTYYSDTPDLDRGTLRAGIHDYATRRGWKLAEIMGEEVGVLPIVLGGDIEGFWRRGPAGVGRSGMRGALFHPTTGYSLPEAVRLADEIVSRDPLDSSALFELTRRRSLDLWRRCGFFRFLNRMLFRAAVPDQRYRIFERFYGLHESLIQRFYGGRLEWTDKLRLLIGKPPVPVHRALRCLFERRRAATVAATIESEETP